MNTSDAPQITSLGQTNMAGSVVIYLFKTKVGVENFIYTLYIMYCFW